MKLVTYIIMHCHLPCHPGRVAERPGWWRLNCAIFATKTGSWCNAKGNQIKLILAEYISKLWLTVGYNTAALEYVERQHLGNVQGLHQTLRHCVCQWTFCLWLPSRLRKRSKLQTETKYNKTTSDDKTKQNGSLIPNHKLKVRAVLSTGMDECPFASASAYLSNRSRPRL